MELKCPVCNGTSFFEEERRLDSRWKATPRKVKVMICRKCKFMMLFAEEGSVWAP
jgi:predicted nucleic-acid-binding Zn-ribbon protein